MKSRGPTAVLFASFFALCLMAAFYFGHISAEKNGIYLLAENPAPENESAQADIGDLDRYFEPEPEEKAEKIETASASLVNLNTATLAQLDTLPGIGQVTAQKIIDYREKYGAFLDTEEIKAVDGIGDGTYMKIRGLVTVR